MVRRKMIDGNMYHTLMTSTKAVIEEYRNNIKNQWDHTLITSYINSKGNPRYHLWVHGRKDRNQARDWEE